MSGNTIYVPCDAERVAANFSPAQVVVGAGTVGSTVALRGTIRRGGGTSITEWFEQAVPAASAAGFDVLVGGMYSWAPAGKEEVPIEYAPRRYIVAVSGGERVGFQAQLSEREDEPRVGVVWPFLATHIDCGGRKCAAEVERCELHIGASLCLERDPQQQREEVATFSSSQSFASTTEERLQSICEQSQAHVHAQAHHAEAQERLEPPARVKDIVCIACDTEVDRARLEVTQLNVQCPMDVFPGVYNAKNRVDGCAASHKAAVLQYALGTTIMESDVRLTKALSWGDWKLRIIPAARNHQVDLLLGGVSGAVPMFAASGSTRLPEHFEVGSAAKCVRIRGGSGFFFYTCLTERALQAFSAVPAGKHIDCEVIRTAGLRVFVVHPFIATVADGISTLSNQVASHSRAVKSTEERIGAYFRRAT